MSKGANPFRCFNLASLNCVSSPEVIRMAVMLYVRYPLSLRNVEDLLSKRGVGIRHEAKTLQKFVSADASFHNHFTSERHLVDRQTYKIRRPTSLARDGVLWRVP